MFDNLFPNIVPFVIQCGKFLKRRASHRRQYNTVHALYMLD